MRDIHSHILYAIDDGALDIDESIEIIKEAIKNNYTDIILTPHYRKRQKYVANNTKKKQIFNKLQEEVQKQNLEINLYLGNEITVDEDLFYYLKTKQILSMNNSRYMMLELPFNGRLKYLDELLDELLENEYIPIIPHPERYNDYKEEDFVHMIKKGVLFQGNIETLYGTYGNKSKKVLINMLKRHMIHFMGSDIHRMGQKIYARDIEKKLCDILNDKNMVLDIISENTLKVINNEVIKPYQVLEEKRFKLFSRM